MTASPTVTEVLRRLRGAMALATARRGALGAAGRGPLPFVAACLERGEPPPHPPPDPGRAGNPTAGGPAATGGGGEVRSHCRFKHRGTDCDSESGMEWWIGSVQSDSATEP